MSLLKLSLVPIALWVGMSQAARVQPLLRPPKIVIEDVDLKGATHLPETVQEQLVVALRNRDFDEQSAWLSELETIVVRAETEGWPERENEGYLGFSVSASWRPIRREPGLLHISVTILVNEGHQKRLKAVTFRYAGTRPVPPVFNSAALRELIPLNDGEIYSRDRLYAGLDALVHVYEERGFIDVTYSLETRCDDTNQTVAIYVELSEGRRYLWGNIQVLGLDQRIETSLRSRLKTGSPVNPKLIEDFYRDYKSVLPVGVSPETVKWRRDTDRAIADLTFDFRATGS